MLEQKYHKPWMFAFRPIPELRKKGGKGILNPINMLNSQYMFDPLPDVDPETEVKSMTQKEYNRTVVYKLQPRSRGISPEDQYSEKGLTAPEIVLTNEPPSMGTEWRNNFYPEEHMEVGYSPLHKVLNLKVKETRLQRQSTIPGGNVLPLTYEQKLIIICRRLGKSGECNAGRPDRTIFEELKERFWYKSIESKANSPKEKAIRYQRLWFFYHIYETMEALRSRTKKCNWRPWLDEEIELCAQARTTIR